MILCDTLRADHLGCYGYERATSPFLDALSQRGLVFSACYAPASRTGPSISSLFTSLYPSFHGAVNSIEAWDQKAILREENRTLPEILRDAGYQTAAVFSNINASAEFGYAQGFEAHSLVNNPPADSVRLRTLDTVAALTPDRPVFLYVHFMDPHAPYRPPGRYRRFFDPGYRGKVSGRRCAQLNRILGGSEVASARDIEHLVAQYDAEIRFFDQELETLMGDLEARGLLEDAILIFLSDHGEEFFEHGGLLHGYTLYEEQLRVPLFISGPGIPTRRIAAPVTLLDLLPTLLGWLEIDPPPSIQGRDLQALLAGEAMPPPILFAEASLKAVRTIRCKSVRQGPWKYIQDLLGEGDELYHLEEDPAERTNRAASEPQLRTHLRRELRAFVQSVTDSTRPTYVPLSEETREQLRSLGYLE